MGSVVFSDSFSQSYIGSGSYDVKVDFSETYNQAANKTTVKITGIAIRKNNNSANYGSMPVYGSIKVGGTTLVTVNGSPAYWVSDGTSYHDVTGWSSSSVDIQHNADGSASTTFQLVAGITANGVSIFGAALLRAAFGSRAASKSVNLTTRPRISSVSATNAYIGEPVTITLNRNNSAFTHTVKVTCAGNTETLMTKGSTYPTLTWTPALATYAPRITSGMAATATVTCETYNGDTLIGQSTTTCTLTLKAADVAPSVSIATADPTGNLTTYGKYVKTKSKIQVTATPTLAYGATLATISISANGATYNSSPATTDFIASASNTGITVTITDSRGQTATGTASIQIYDYAPPKINAFAAHRCNSDGTSNNAGAYFSVDYDIAIAALGNHNTKSLKVKYKKLNDATYTEQTFTPASYTEIASTPPIAADTNKTFNVAIVLSDAFGEATGELILPTASTRMNWGPGENGGLAIGKVNEYDKTLEVADDWAVKGKGFIDLIYPVGSIYMSVNSTSPATLFGGTWVQIEDTFLLSAGSTYTAGATGGEASHTLTKDEMPSHSHSLYGGDDSNMPDYLGGSSANYGIHTSGTQYAGRMTSVGGGQSHNNMPPYLVVYMWKRTA